MIEFLTENNLIGLVVGIFTFLIIGLFHPLVIKSEYYFGTKSWVFFLLLGLGSCVISIMASSIILSVLFGVITFSSFWSIIEVFEQSKRVKKGWFPENPRRKKKC